MPVVQETEYPIQDSYPRTSVFTTPMVRCYTIVWYRFLRVFSVLSPSHLRVMTGGNTFECGTNRDGGILEH